MEAIAMCRIFRRQPGSAWASSGAALRTAAYTVLSARALAVPEPATIGIIGCDVLGETHARHLATEYPSARFVVYDQESARATAVQDQLTAGGIPATAADSASEAVAGA